MSTDSALFGYMNTLDVSATNTVTGATIEIPEHGATFIWMRVTVAPVDSFGTSDYRNYQREYIARRAGSGSVSNTELSAAYDGTYSLASISVSAGSTSVTVQCTAGSEDVRFIIITQSLTNIANS